MSKQVYNPYMPTFEYVPDGEPHVFDGRIYLYGSHDRFDGAQFCLNDYVCYSADVNDLTDWRYEGIIYRKEQDPRNQNVPADAQPFEVKPGIEVKENSLNPPGIHAMWAPDVVRGLDGKYYLYYCLDYLPEIAVAVCDKPAGKYEFLGFVRHEDGTALGKREGDLIQFDPGIFIDDDKTIYLYSGNAPMHKECFDAEKGSQVMTLKEDMLTLATEPKHLLPDIHEAEGTEYDGHAFFEASSIRKINGRYYFVYSSVRSHELCYAVSDRPDGGYRFGGTLVDIADIFLNGRKDDEPLNCLGNTHGGIECAAGQWYVFYHRQTNRTNYSRQGCAEKIYFDEKGAIAQAEVTSCGLNKGPLEGTGTYPAAIACQINRSGKQVLSMPDVMKEDYPYLTQDVPDFEPADSLAEKDRMEPVQYIKNIKDGSVMGYKYFTFDGMEQVTMLVRGKADGRVMIAVDTPENVVGELPINLDAQDWIRVCGKTEPVSGIHALYFCFKGSGVLDFSVFKLENAHNILRGEQHEQRTGDRFNIGVDIVDKAHKQLFSTMNRLLAVSEHKVKSRWVCEEGIKYLRSHTMKHFAEEEEYMKSVGYSGYERHRRIHRDFRLKTLPALERELEDTNYSVDAVRHFLGVCIGWMTAHTLTEDQAITGRIPSKWEELLPEEDIAALEKTIIRTMREMFMLDARVINGHYRGEDFGKGIYYRLVCEIPGGERRETIFILENQLLTGTVGAMLGIQFDKVDDVVVNATRYISRQFLKRVKACFASGAQQEVVEESLMTAGQFQEIFEKVNPECSLLFGTEAGYFVFCSFKASSESSEAGRTINAQNAMDEIKKYLDTDSKKKILVVDDSNAVRAGLKKLLDKNYKVASVNSGAAALKAVTVERPDLILLDLEMPECDGIQTLKMLRSEGKIADIPVIFLTGRVDQQSVERIMSVKPAGYMLKTMRTVDIKKNIDSFFVRK